MGFLETLTEYWSQPFIRYAFIVVVLIALCSSLLGVTLVLKRLSFMGDGLSHVAFGALAVAMVAGITDKMIIVMPITVGMAVLLLGIGKKTRIKGDAAIAMLSVGALAIGYILMHKFPSGSGNISGDVCSTLFGSTSLLTLSSADMYVSIVLSVTVIALYIVFYNKIFAVTFDENFARATGTGVVFYRLGIAVVIGVVIVLAMNLVGSLLVSALIVFPTLSATRVLKSFRGVIIFAAVYSVVCAVFGMILSIFIGTPVGATIVAVNIVAFLIFTLIGAIHEF